MTATSERARPTKTPSDQTGRRALRRWTRTQSIRTAAAIPVEVAIVERVEAPAYPKLAEKAKHLQELGMSDKAIARALGVNDKTVAKAIERGRNT